MLTEKIKGEIQKLKNPEKKKALQRFFKTGKGEYGEGDIFLGLTSAQMGQIVKKYFKDVSLKDLEQLLHTKIHEYRSIALGILVKQFEKTSTKRKKQIYKFYLTNTPWVNNWDLVDSSAPKIIGPFLLERPKQRKILYRLSKSKNLWQKRIAIISTLAFIRQNQFEETLKIAEILVNDHHDLIHKAVGWMLREVGKKDQKLEEKFLLKHYQTMPRTMLRYAIEKFSDHKRDFYLGRTASDTPKGKNQKEKPTIIIIPGLLGHGRNFSVTTKFFKDRGYPIKLIETSNNTVEIKDIIENAQKQIKRLKTNNVVLWGCSFSGPVVVQMAIKMPQKIKLLILGTPIYRPRFKGLTLKAAGAIEMAVKKLPRQKVIKFIVSHLQKEGKIDFSLYYLDINVYAGRIRSFIKNKIKNSQLKKITCPTIIYAPDNDRLAPLKQIKKKAKLIKTSELILINNTNHLLSKKQVKSISTKIERFLQKYLD